MFLLDMLVYLPATCELPNRSDSRSVNHILIWKFPQSLRHVTVMMLADMTLLLLKDFLLLLEFKCDPFEENRHSYSSMHLLN